MDTRKLSAANESYEDAARLTGASICRIRLMFPDGKIDMDAVGRLPSAAEDSFSRGDIADIFGVSIAAVDKWVRMGRLTFTPTGEEADALYRAAEDGKLLRSRRNKGFISGNVDYACYLGECPESGLVCELARRFRTPSESVVRTVLCELTLRLMKSAGLLEGEVRGSLFKDFLSGEITAGRYSVLLDELAPDSVDEAALGKLSDIKPKYNEGQDFLGAAYISMSDKRRRKLCGLYFTPERLARCVVGHIEDDLSGDVCDPCCGSGAMLMQCVSEDCELYGSDSDDICVCLTRINLALLTKPEDIEQLFTRIVRRDILENPWDRKFDIIITNPPWGAAVKGRSDSIRRDSCDLITDRCAELLADGGILAVILPEAMLSTRTHRAIRFTLMQRLSLSLVDYPRQGFGDVWCPCVIAVSRNMHSDGRVRIISGRGSFDTSPRPDDYSMLITDGELGILRQMEKTGGLTLRNNAEFALGIVTGANRTRVLNERCDGMEPILRGTDIMPFVYSEPRSFIRFDTKFFQQCAPEKYYRAPEKIVYRFIGKKPVFAIDTTGMLTLNSCNILIPHIDGLSIYAVLAILNSLPARFYISARFSSRKLLRRHLEALPIAMPSAKDCAALDSAARRLVAGEKDEELMQTVNDILCRAYELDGEQIHIMNERLACQKIMG